MLTATGLDHSYTIGTPVLRGVSLSLAPGRVTALVGPNGSGKSTLIRCLAGLLTPGAGRIELDGRPVRSWSPAERARRLAYVAQRPEVAFGFSTLDAVRFGLLASGHGQATGAQATEAALASLERVGLADRAGEPFAHLSVGQQQRAALARALAQMAAPGPPGRVLLADEPVSAMDPRHALRAMEQIRGLAAGGGGPEAGSGVQPAACLMAIHDLSLAARFADEAVLLDRSGAVAASGPAGDVLTPERLAPVFGVGFARVDEPAPALIPLGP